jgi:hypothetical protein
VANAASTFMPLVSLEMSSASSRAIGCRKPFRGIYCTAREEAGHVFGYNRQFAVGWKLKRESCCVVRPFRVLDRERNLQLLPNHADYLSWKMGM